MLKNVLEGLGVLGICLILFYATLAAYCLIESSTRPWRLKIEENRRKIESEKSLLRQNAKLSKKPRQQSVQNSLRLTEQFRQALLYHTSSRWPIIPFSPSPKQNNQ